MNTEPYEPSPIVRDWDEIGDDMKIFLQNPYSWISNELKKSADRRSSGPKYEQWDTLMEILDLLNSIYSPAENHCH